jgi:phage anti-repressor protein
MSRITLKDFLIKFTAVPEKFINEYYAFYELCENDNFGIPSEKVGSYLGITNQYNFNERIRESYELNIDYVIIRQQQKSMKGVKDAHYMLSFEAFEKICMNSSTKKGQMFRDYFVMLRKFIDYYKQHITDKILELTQTSKFIYILTVNKKTDLLKLGRTGNMRKRLQAYSTGKEKHPDIKFIMIVEDDKRVEKCAKLFAKANQYKGNRELYKMHNDALKSIVFACAKLDKRVVENLSNPKLDTYVVYDDSKNIEYLNLKGDVIGSEFGVRKPVLGVRRPVLSTKSPTSAKLTKKRSSRG